MILRKPYAFLIKHFKIINFFLFVSTFFCLNRVLSLYRFIKEYLVIGIYNETLSPISNYIDFYLYFALILMIIVSFILFYLLKRKEKPFLSYIYMMILSFVSLALFIYIHNYFVELEVFNGQIARLIRDLTLIDSFFYYPVLIILLIRFLGIDLKSFGFYQDKEFLSSNELDREEVEVEVGFDREKYIRLLKNKIRYSKYFFLEHKVPVLGVLGIILLISIFYFYQYLYIENKIYEKNETFTSDGYQIMVQNTYLTDKDYTGNVISSSNRYFIILDVSVKNLITTRTFDASKLLLYIDDIYYTPTTRFNEYFVDLGVPVTKDINLPTQEEKKYIIIYEVEKPKKDSNFLLKYQSTTTKNNKEIRVKLQVLDITQFKQRESSSLTNALVVPVNEKNKYEFTFSTYEITNQKSYTYQSCSNYNCPIYEKTLSASSNKTLLFLKFDSEISTSSFLSFLKKYGKVRYQIDGQEYLEKINLKVTNYHGRYVYLEVNNSIQNAEIIDFVFTIRTNQYTYHLKG